MNKRHLSALTALALATSVTLAYAAEDSDADRSRPKEYVKDSVITTKIKAKLAAEHATSLAHISVDTDRDGVVYLSGTAKSPEAVEKAGEIARDTKNVRDVHNEIRVKKDD